MRINTKKILVFIIGASVILGLYWFQYHNKHIKSTQNTTIKIKKIPHHEKSKHQSITPQNIAINPHQYNATKMAQFFNQQSNPNTPPAPIATAFYQWAIDHYQKLGYAVSDWIFSPFSPQSKGDYYANTPDGLIQIINNQHPGYQHFKLHLLGGILIFNTRNGQIGAIPKQILQNPNQSYANYNQGANTSLPMYKYFLADNGIIYEADNATTPFVGYGQFGSDGQINGTNATQTDSSLFISPDQTAQIAYQKILQPLLIK